MISSFPLHRLNLVTGPNRSGTSNLLPCAASAQPPRWPLPKVFSDVDGLETFGSEFTLHYRHPDGERRHVPITPQLYGRLAGPYNRRNVYGAALSYAPRLPRELWESIYCYGLAPAGPLRRELASILAPRISP